MDELGALIEPTENDSQCGVTLGADKLLPASVKLVSTAVAHTHTNRR